MSLMTVERNRAALLWAVLATFRMHQPHPHEPATARRMRTLLRGARTPDGRRLDLDKLEADAGTSLAGHVYALEVADRQASGRASRCPLWLALATMLQGAEA